MQTTEAAVAEDRANQLARAAAIRLERMPSPSRARPIRSARERAWRQMVREHLQREKAIREYAPVLRRRIAEIDAVGTAG